MRKLIPAVLLVLAGSWAAAQEPVREQPSQATESKSKKEMTAIVVATDPTVKTITVRKEKSAPESQPETLPVAGAAVAHLVTVKTGEKVKLVLTMDPATNKESVTAIEKPSPRPDQP
jgi:predicted RND superfamily exporter protein